MNVETTPFSRRRRPGRTAAALLSLIVFGCTTIRAPVSAIAPTIPVEDGQASPQVELWLESGRPIGPNESARASAEVRAALQAAMARRQAGAGDQLLVVRAQGVSRTASRRSDQGAAVAGLVVGAVVVVAVVVLAVVSGKGSGGKGSGGAVKSGGRGQGWSTGATAARPRPPGGGAIRPSLPVAGVRPSPPLPGLRPRPSPPGGWAPPRPGSHWHGSPEAHVWIGWSAEVRVPWAPVYLDELEPTPLLDLQRPWTWSPAPLADQEALEASAAISLPPLPPLPVDERGFFAGDTLRLELTLVDRATGEPAWVKRVEKDVDPRDARAVQALLDGALDDPKGWVAAER